MDAHENEYLAAVAGLHEQTISPRPEPAVGDFVSGTTAGRSWSGYVEWCEGGRMTINADGSWLAVPVTDITH
jgi:hypothetical protein